MTRISPTIVLMGLRGSGKSTIGRLLAERLRGTFLDLDDLTPGVLGASSVAEAWAKHGEAGFRKAEAAALRGVFEQKDVAAVLALGGGTPTGQDAQTMLRDLHTQKRIQLIYLRATPASLRERLTGEDNTHRPPLTAGAKDPLNEIGQVFAARDPLYRGLADAIIGTDDLSTEQVLDAIEGLWA